jgi:hypothetical protein
MVHLTLHHHLSPCTGWGDVIIIFGRLPMPALDGRLHCISAQPLADDQRSAAAWRGVDREASIHHWFRWRSAAQ